MRLSSPLSFPALLLSILSLSAVGVATTKYHGKTFTPDLQLRITEEIISQSCLPAKATVLINGTSPGPLVRLKVGKTYWIRIHNDMKDNNATMHWHGLSMATAPFSDGAPLASQWPIPPGYFFDYEIHVPPGMEGTYFYHSHVGFDAVSATAPLIVDGRGPPPFRYDEEKIVFLQDVFKKNDSAIEKGLVATPLGWSGESDMILINGRGGGDANGTYCNATLSSINVKPGKTYFVRFIGATALTFSSLMLEGHEFEIVEVDGFYVKNYKTSLLQIGNGQRFGVLLRTKKHPEKSTYTLQVESRERPTVTRSFAIFNYGKKPFKPFYPPTVPVITLPPTDLNFLEYKLEPRSQPSRHEFPSASEVTRRVTITAHQRVAGKTTWLSNGFSWTEDFPKEPYLVSLYKQDRLEYPNMTRALENNGLDPVTRTFPARIGEVLEIVIQNTGADAGGLDSHPWHAHGAHYWDLGSGNGTYDPVANEAKLAKSPHPVKRDTTMLYRYGLKTENGTEAGWRAWRIRFQQPGVWMIHCHILQHMVMGMQTVWAVGNETELLRIVPRPEVKGYLDFGGDVYGNGTHWPTVVDYFGAWTDTQ